MNIRNRLSLALAAVILLALLLAGSAFVFLRRDSREQQTLDHLASVAPQVALELRALQRAGASPDQIGELLRQAARDRDVRILLVDRDRVVTEDSGGTLLGEPLDVPADTDGQRSLYRTWTASMGGERLVFLFVPQFPAIRAQLQRQGAEPPDMVVLAVPAATVAGAWRDLLPGLLWAGAIALVVSFVVAALLARSIARPLTQLTRASEAMARGDFDQAIAVRRADEVGRLAEAFNVMAREVGRGHMQVRALIANVSHDLKTPLTSVLGFSQALRDRTIDDPDAVVEAAGIIHDEAERVQALVDDLLYLSEIEARQVPLASGPVDLGALALRCARRFAPRFEEGGIAIRVDTAGGDVAPTLGDAAKLERVLDNLLDNALKYTASGGAVLVRVTADEEVRVSVHNSGSPIPAEELPRIFDRFHRLDRARSGTARGSGLGLSIARELAEMHGGSLTADSDPAGAVFTLRLPRIGQPSDPAPREGAGANRTPTPQPG